MKRKRLLVIFLLSIVLTTGCINRERIEKHSEIEESVKEKRYSEIRESVKEAVDKKMKVMHPYCDLAFDKSLDGEFKYESNSSELIYNGYMEKEELLDVDEKSYCDVYFIYSPKYNIPLNNQEDCYVSYKIYLKCKYLEDDGYIETEEYKLVYYN